MCLISEKLNPSDIEIIIEHLGIGIDKKPKQDGWLTIKSPIREEKHPSFGLNIKTGAWKDHGTDESGDLIKLVENIQNWKTSQAIKFVKEVSLVKNFSEPSSSKIYSPMKDAKRSGGIKFWTESRVQILEEAQRKLKTSDNHPLLEKINSYDCIDVETLVHYGVGFIKKWNRHWFIFPYDSGSQLYRREAGDKKIRCLKGSKPGKSFFGKTKISGRKADLIIAKSPREAMLLHQLYNDRVDSIGLVTGEQSAISDSQIEWIKNIASKHSYKRIIVIIDCYTNQAYSIARKLCERISEIMHPTPVQLVNISNVTGEKFKDITDCIRAGMSRDLLWRIISNSQSINVSTNEVEREHPQKTKLIDRLDLSTAPFISETVYNNLPEVLKEICFLIEEQHRRDVFLVSALPAISAQMPKVLAEHRDCYYSPDLFTQVIADPGSGKGEASKGRALAKITDQKIRKEANREIEEYSQNPDEENANLDKPKKRSLFIPANASSRKMLDRLEANGGNGFIFETEIDTLVDATNQEWGNYTDTVRKAFQHEPLSIIRTDEEYYIDNPRLSICLTGTFDQFKKMFKSAENGHFSRYALYTFDTPRRWKSHRPSNQSKKLRESISELSQKFYEMYKRLSNRRSPLYINLKHNQWDHLDSVFSEKMELIELLNLSKHLHASNNRTGVIALRLISILTVLRAFEKDPNRLSLEKNLIPNSSDVTVALELAEIFIEHAIRLYHILPESNKITDSRGERFVQFYKKLPEKFTTGKAIKIGEESEIPVPERTVKDWLRKDDGIFKKISHGMYKKQKS